MNLIQAARNIIKDLRTGPKARPVHILEVLQEAGRPLKFSQIHDALRDKLKRHPALEPSGGWIMVQLRRYQSKGMIRVSEVPAETLVEIGIFGPDGLVPQYSLAD